MQSHLISISAIAAALLAGCSENSPPGPETPPPPPEVHGANSDERHALAELDQAIDGEIVYAKFLGEGRTNIEKIRIGEWEPVPLITDGQYPRWSPDGQQIAFFKAKPDGNQSTFWLPGELWVMDSDGKNLRLLTTEIAAGELGLLCPLDFHPNGDEIVFLNADYHLKAISLKTGAVRRLGTGDYYTGEPQLSNDGRYLVTRGDSRGSGGDFERPVILVDLVAGKEEPYSFGCCSTISPDGGWLTTNSPNHREMYFWSRQLDQQAAFFAKKSLKPHGLWDNWHWSNHPRYLAVKSDGKPANGKPDDAFVLDIATRKSTRVTFDRDIDYPDLFVASPAGQGDLSAEEIGTHPADARALLRQLVDAKERSKNGITTVVARCKLRRKTPVPAPSDIPYKHYLVQYEWQIVEMVEGQWFAGKFVGVHQAIYDRQPDPEIAGWEKDDIVTLTLQSWDDRPDLHNLGIGDLDDESPNDLPIYVEADAGA